MSGVRSTDEGEFTAAELIHTCRTMDAAGVPPDASEEAVRAVALVLRWTGSTTGVAPRG